jgi:hypothetical protein
MRLLEALACICINICGLVVSDVSSRQCNGLLSLVIPVDDCSENRLVASSWATLWSFIGALFHFSCKISESLNSLLMTVFYILRHVVI